MKYYVWLRKFVLKQSIDSNHAYVIVKFPIRVAQPKNWVTSSRHQICKRLSRTAGLSNPRICTEPRP